MSFMEGGRRRIDRVLAPGYLDGMTSWPLERLRECRAEAEQEEVDLSFARRLLHGRLDLLRAEQRHRGRGTGGLRDADTTDEMVRSLAGVLADQPTAPFGGGRHTVRAPSRVGEHRRAAEAAVADVQVSDLGSLDDAALQHAADHLSGLEHEVSEARRQVQRVLDELSAELGRRYREGLADVGDVLDRVRPTA